MREIKFRGKGLLDKEWIYGGYFILRGETKIACEEYKGPNGKLIYWTVDPATVGQYTGLKDKNGVEVYEGDILSRNDAQFPMRGPVEYENGGFYFHDEELGFCQYLLPDIAKRGVLKELEVVGNIHDDAGLLTPKDN